ncbi:MAG: hypothetical protein K9G76_05050 [Bacteroidales bacterium]|nr:hypothetical protein [Bacteroidales bacterium]MCF8403047.1 hypothetical protein [Bacteroidales bacterium]
MIKYLRQEEIDNEKWDHCIDNSFNGVVYAKSWYLNVVAENWDALVENDYERIFPLTRRKKYGIDYLFQPPFTQQLGLFSTTQLNEDIVANFIEAIPEQIKFAEINLNTLNKLPEGRYNVKEWTNHELDLINSHDKISGNYSTNIKRNLKKAYADHLTLSKSIKPDDVIALFRTNRGKTIDNLRDEDYLKLSRLAYSGIYKGLVSTYGVYSPNNELCAGVIFLRSYKKIVFLFSGLSAEGRNLNAMAFLIDHFIKDHHGQHLTLDFEGSNDPQLARFYKSFGSEVTTYPHLQINKLPRAYKIGLNLLKRFNK